MILFVEYFDYIPIFALPPSTNPWVEFEEEIIVWGNSLQRWLSYDFVLFDYRSDTILLCDSMRCFDVSSDASRGGDPIYCKFGRDCDTYAVPTERKPNLSIMENLDNNEKKEIMCSSASNTVEQAICDLSKGISRDMLNRDCEPSLQACFIQASQMPLLDLGSDTIFKLRIPGVLTEEHYTDNGLILCWDCSNPPFINGISQKMIDIFPDINAIYIKHTGSNGIITDAMRFGDGKSLHYQGKAIDLRTNYLSDDVVRSIVKDLKFLFDKDYDILDEHNEPISGVTTGPHIHIEYDPK